MLRVGVVGLGCMGSVHSKRYLDLESTELVAICDVDQSKFEIEKSVEGNIRGLFADLDLSGVEFFSDFDEMVSKMNLDAVSITLPTYLHKEFSIKAMKAGLHVLCEKPMAMNPQECLDMMAVSKDLGKVLQIGQCIRFWPEYKHLKQLVDSGEYGEVLVATFRRLSSAPQWSYNNWLMDGDRSGGALFDLHVHDADYVQHLLGMPKGVYAKGVSKYSGQFDHVQCNYIYGNDNVISSEGSWLSTPGCPFDMSFRVQLEGATVILDGRFEGAYKLYLPDQEPITPELDKCDAYMSEIKYFVSQIKGEAVDGTIDNESALDTIRLVLAERESAESGRPVEL